MPKNYTANNFFRNILICRYFVMLSMEISIEMSISLVRNRETAKSITKNLTVTTLLKSNANYLFV